MFQNLTYTDDGHFLYMILETLRLLAGISLSHEVDGRTAAMTWEYISVEFRRGCVGWTEESWYGFQKYEK